MRVGVTVTLLSSTPILITSSLVHSRVCLTGPAANNVFHSKSLAISDTSARSKFSGNHRTCHHAHSNTLNCLFSQCPVTRASRNPNIFKHYRTIFERSCRESDVETFERNIGNLVTLLRSQRMHKVRNHILLSRPFADGCYCKLLLERYNPLHDLSTEERVKATARRVGLDMPIEGHSSKE